MKRTIAIALAVLLAAAPAVAADDLVRARVLDQEGVRLYREGKYRDAMEQFHAARDLGGPPSELWNIARCHGKLGENKEEAEAIEKYLGEPGLTKDDRAEAAAELYRLQRLPSPLTVNSDPPGARVKVDGTVIGDAPVSTTVAPGTHRIVADHPRWTAPVEKDVDTVYGAHIEWTAQGTLREDGARGDGRAEGHGDGHGDAHADGHGEGRGGDARHGSGDHGAESTQSWLAERPTLGLLPSFAIGVGLPQYGGIGGSAHAEASLRVLYAIWRQGDNRVLVGGRGMVTGDSWTNTVNAPTTISGCALFIDQDATSWALVAVGAYERTLGPFRVGGELGVGAGVFSASQVGGDLFNPSCNPGTKAQPTFHLAADVSYDITRRFRIHGSPLMFDFTPSYDGVRSQPKDATGLWVRVGLELGLAFEF